MFKDSDTCLNALPNGAFLTSGKTPCNVMTIGWGGLMVMWRKQIFVAPIRGSRYTKELMDKTGSFAVSIPKNGEMKKELALCGTVSGRDKNKIDTLHTTQAKNIDTLLIDGCAKYYECKTLAVLPLEDNMLPPQLKEFYKDGDYHYLYFGEIIE